ncbi:MAG: hypothetical protein ACRD6W_00605 [Nitrososphaerales archaeon]
MRFGDDHVTAKAALIWLAGLRLASALVALPMAAFLYRHHFLILVLLRPSLGVLLAGAILARHGQVSLPQIVGASIPLQLLAIWLYFLLGQAWESEIEGNDRLPFMAARILQPNQIRRLRNALRSRGIRLIVLARFAIFPVGLLAAAAGAADMNPREFFPADALAFAAAVGLVVGIGYGLGISTDEAGPWLAAGGACGLVVLSGILTWYVWHGSGSDSDRDETSSS